MTTVLVHPGRWCLLVALLVAAGPVQAGWLGFRNETSQPVIVRRASGKPFVLYPGEVSWNSVAHQGAKRIVVYDARKRPILQTSVTVGKDDQFFGIRPARPAGVRLTALPLPARKRH